MTKTDLAKKGRDLIKRMCSTNDWMLPRLYEYVPKYGSGSGYGCGMYCHHKIYVDSKLCASPGRSGAAWSWPGYIIDRTPYGVYAHELGHYWDDLLSDRQVQLATALRDQSGELPLTSYCPNDSEWLAEMFRLFTTNPDLLRLVRPRTYAAFIDFYLEPVELRTWREVLEAWEAPERTLRMAEKRVCEAAAKTLA